MAVDEPANLRRVDGEDGPAVEERATGARTARIQLEEPVKDDPSTVFNRPTTMRRYFPQLAAGQWDKPPVDELTLSHAA